MRFEGKTLVEVTDNDIVDGTYQIHPKIKRIGTMAFAGCKRLVNIEIPVTVKFLGFDVFDRCDNLRAIAWGDFKWNHYIQKHEVNG